MKSEIDKKSGYVPLRVELNFLRQFIFTFDKKKVGMKGKISVTTVERVNEDGSKEKATLTIETDMTYGLGGPFDFKAFRTVEKILSDIYGLTGELTSGPICLGKERSILTLMNTRNPNEADYHRLREFFKRMLRMKFFSERAIFNTQKKKWAEGDEALDPIYKNVVFTHQEMPNGSMADAVYVWLGDLYLASLNNRYIALIDYSFYSSIKSLAARRLYEIISLYAHKHPIVYLWYSEICSRMQIRREKYISEAREKLARKYSELIKNGFITKVTWPDQDVKLQTREYEGSLDWIIWFYINKSFKARPIQQPELRLVTIGNDKEISDIGATQEVAKESCLPNVLPFDSMHRAQVFPVTQESEQDPLKRFIKFFSKKYLRKFNKKPFINVKEQEAVRPLLKEYPNEDLAKLVAQFFISTHPAITKSSYAVSYFATASVINRLNIELSNRMANDICRNGISNKTDLDGDKVYIRDKIKKFNTDYSSK